MIALTAKDLALACLAVLLAQTGLLLADRVIAGFVQCEAAGSCPNQAAPR